MPVQLPPEVREIAMHVARATFPHDDLPDEAYAKVVDQLESDASGDDTVLPCLAEGVRTFEGFPELDEAARTDRLKQAEADGDACFKLIHATAVVALYDNPLVWKAFGYEGPSVHLGGYVDRGFDDLDWLPDPPLVSQAILDSRQEA